MQQFFNQKSQPLLTPSHPCFWSANDGRSPASRRAFLQRLIGQKRKTCGFTARHLQMPAQCVLAGAKAGFQSTASPTLTESNPTNLGQTTIPIIGKHSGALSTQRMSAMGQKRTSRATPIYVRYWGQSGYWQAPDPES